MQSNSWCVCLIVSSVGVADCDVMALIEHIIVLSTALPRNKHFSQTCWINFFPFLSSSGAADGCVAYSFLAPYMMGACGYGGFRFFFLSC